MDYALMLNGGWGCGKTYYVEHDLKENIEASGGILLYASLHGLRSYEELNAQLMCARIAYASNVECKDVKDAYLMGKILKDLRRSESVWCRVSSSIISHFNLRDAKKAARVDRNNIFIVIDDLERALSADVLRNVIGSIYEEYIHNGYHVLFVCDEAKIPEASGFRESKEKYIRQTIDITQYQDGLSMLFVKQKLARIPWLFELIKDPLQKFINAKRVVNLRVISMFCDGMIDVIAGFDEEFAKKYATFIFASLIPLLHATSIGLITARNQEDYSGLTNLMSVRMFHASPEKRENLSESMSLACKFYDEYCSGINEGYTFIKSLFRYAVAGILRHDCIRQEIKEICEKAATPEGAAFEKLKSYSNLEEAELRKWVGEVVGFLDDGKYSFKEIVTIYAYLWFIKNETYLSEWPYEDNLDEMFFRYIDKRSEKQGDTAPISDYLDFDMEFSHYIDSAAPAKPLLDKIRAIYEEKIHDANADRVNQLFAALIRRDESTADKLVTPLDGHWNFFDDLVTYGKLKDVAKLPVCGLQFIKWQARYHIILISNSADYEYRQVPAIKSLIEQLKLDITDSGMPKSKKTRVQELITVLGRAIEHMENYRNQNPRA